MINSSIHKILVATGSLIWCTSFFGEGFDKQPYSTFGIVISPILTIIGIICWFRFYRETRGYYPKIKTLWDNTIGFGSTLTLRSDFIRSHMLEFWTFWILLWMGLVLLAGLTFSNSDAFETAKQYCQTNQEIPSKTGEIKYYGTFISGEISTEEQKGFADLSFTIVGTKGNFHVNSKLVKKNGFWNVEKYKIR